MNQEELDNLEPGDKVMHTETGVVGEVILKSTPMGSHKRLNFSSDDIAPEKVPENILPEDLKEMPLCDGEHENFTYLDSEEKWVCPICDL